MIFGRAPEWYEKEDEGGREPVEPVEPLVCAECGNELYDYYWSINDEIYCDDCAEDLFRHPVDD